MSVESVLKDLEKTIKRVCRDINKKKGSVGSDKMDSLAKLTNAYTRLHEKHKLAESDFSNGEGQDYVEVLDS